MSCEHERRAPYVRGSDTSEAAALEIAHDLPRLEQVVMSYSGGLTADEVEVRTSLPHQTVSARIRGLVLRGLLEDSGERCLTRSGRKAAVWVQREPESEPVPPPVTGSPQLVLL